MTNYNLVAEYTSLVIVMAILVSFLRDYESRNLRYKFLYAMYVSTFLSSLATISSTHLANGVDFGLPYAFVYCVMLLYFILLPSVSLMFLLYAFVLTNFKEDEKNYFKKLMPVMVPYIIYLIALSLNVFNSSIFSITSGFLYVRGPFYQLPFVIILVHIFMLLFLTIKNMNTIYKEIMQVLSFTFIFSSSITIVQLFIDNISFSGIAHTLSILLVHLYIQNVRKSADHLTGINNRITLTHKLNEAIKKNEVFSLYILSIRNFKGINERYGLETGDKILQYIAQTLSKNFKYNNIFRYSGDEFAIISKFDTPDFFNNVLNTVISFDKSFSVDNIDIVLDLVFTKVDYPQFGTNTKDLISAADYSIRTLKENNLNSKYLYDISILKNMNEWHSMTNKIKNAIENDLFVVHYQPIYSLDDNQFTHAEALVRMRDSSGEILYPNSFISLSEKTGLIVKITYKVLEIVCRDLRYLIDNSKLPSNFESVSINFPYYQFDNLTMVDNVLEILNKYNIPPSMLNIEITERTLISDDMPIEQIMQTMQEKGFVFELDDFGIDYSNMNVFLKLPLDIIKIDRSLLLSAAKSNENAEFFKHLILGIKATNKKIIIEGVEDENLRDFCISAGCNLLQGYLYSKPISLDDLIIFLNN